MHIEQSSTISLLNATTVPLLAAGVGLRILGEGAIENADGKSIPVLVSQPALVRMNFPPVFSGVPGTAAEVRTAVFRRLNATSRMERLRQVIGVLDCEITNIEPVLDAAGMFHGRRRNVDVRFVQPCRRDTPRGEERIVVPGLGFVNLSGVSFRTVSVPQFVIPSAGRGRVLSAGDLFQQMPRDGEPLRLLRTTVLEGGVLALFLPQGFDGPVDVVTAALDDWLRRVLRLDIMCVVALWQGSRRNS